MSLQVGPLVEAATADRTFVRRLFQMQDLVDGQSTRLAESFAAFGTLEGFLLRMDVPVTEDAGVNTRNSFAASNAN